ncbi:hypothetical protein FRC20_007536 [Serendipita sp. 405]|nr:hypothetical protein FRC20_007536 [Serendipita sp. 405]
MLVIRDSEVAQAIQHSNIGGLALVASQIRASYYTILAGWVIYCYDISLTLEDEYRLLWSKGGKFVKPLYLINRYLPFCGLLLVLYANNPVRRGHLTDEICKGTFILTLLCQTVEIIVAISIFAIRIYTIYQRSKVARRLLTVVVVVSHVTLLAIACLICKTIYDTMFYSRILRSCVGSPPALSGALYITPIVAESFILAMTLHHAVQFSRRHADLEITMAARILNALYVDGCFYYLIVFSLHMGTTLVYYFGGNALVLLMPYLEYALTSTVTSRWFLSFRRTLAETLDSGLFTTCHTDRTEPTIGPSITFGQGGRGFDLHRTRRQDRTHLVTHGSIDADGILTLEIDLGRTMAHEMKELEAPSSMQLSTHEWDPLSNR